MIDHEVTVTSKVTVTLLQPFYLAFSFLARAICPQL